MTEPISGVEIIVGMPSYKEADSIGYVVQQADRGLATYFGQHKALIVNVDNASEDNTRGAFLATKTTTPKHYVSTPEGVRGKGNNFRNLFELAATQLDTLKAVVVVDADLKSITPEWIKYLTEPILNGKDYALPLYSRHQFDGTITNHICYPLIYALFGQNLRQPIGGDFGFSPALVEHWLDQQWVPTTYQYGIDIFMTGNALAGDFSVCEVGLGAKVHKASAPKLGPMFTQVVATLFDLLLANRRSWETTPVAWPEPVQRFGLSKMDPPQQLSVDLKQMKDKLRAEYEPRKQLLNRLLDSYSCSRLHSMFEQDHYDVDILMWTQIVYKLLHAYDTEPETVKGEVIEALRPLYFARSVAYDYLTWRYSLQWAEAAILEQAKAFASQKPYLLGLYHNDTLAQS